MTAMTTYDVVEVGYPVKQGLKQLRKWIVDRGRIVEVGYPVKQGLKLGRRELSGWSTGLKWGIQ